MEPLFDSRRSLLVSDVDADLIALVRAVWRAGYGDGRHDADPEGIASCAGESLSWADDLTDDQAERMVRTFRLVGAVVFRQC
jgi:hypothetical protein